MPNPSANLAEVVQPATAVGWLITVLLFCTAYYFSKQKEKVDLPSKYIFVFVVMGSLCLGELCSYLNMKIEQITFAEKISVRTVEWSVWLASWPLIIAAAAFLAAPTCALIQKKFSIEKQVNEDDRIVLTWCGLFVVIKSGSWVISILISRLLPDLTKEFGYRLGLVQSDLFYYTIVIGGVSAYLWFIWADGNNSVSNTDEGYYSNSNNTLDPSAHEITSYEPSKPSQDSGNGSEGV